MSGVENRRISGSLPVAFVNAAFAGRASVRFGMALFPVPAHRTGQAHLAHRERVRYKPSPRKGSMRTATSAVGRKVTFTMFASHNSP